MKPPTDPARYKNHRFPGEIISHGVWLYYRFPLSYRDVEEILFERGIDVTHEAIRQWCLKFGQDYANQLKHRRAQPGDKWHLDEVFLTINGKRHYLWRAVDQDDNVLDILVQSRRNKQAAKKFFRKLLKGLQYVPRVIITDKLKGFVHRYDTKPKRRLFEVLKSQGMQANQQLTFLSDGGDTVRQLPRYLHPDAEHVLDWFHCTMRITVMQQMAKGLPSPGETAGSSDIPDHLDRLKWALWHGNVYKALQKIEYLEMDLEAMEESPEQRKLLKAVREFGGYIAANRPFIPNYGDRYRNGEPISTAMAESTVNQVISKRFVKKQQMKWTKRGAHLLLQVRTKVLNGELRGMFCRWYPAMQTGEEPVQRAA
jgi:transposase-like protein